MNITYKNYILKQSDEGSRFDLFEKYTTSIKDPDTKEDTGETKETERNMGWSMTLTSGINKIIMCELSKREETRPLREAIAEINRIRAEIETPLKGL